MKCLLLFKVGSWGRKPEQLLLPYWCCLLYTSAACSNSDDAEKPVTPVATGDVTIYATTSSLTRDLTRDAVNFSSKDNLAPTSITLNPTEQYQTMDGFGAAITGATCFNLLQMKPEDRHAFLTETFSDDKGFGFSYIRISIGCSDFSLSEYTCCDTKGIRCV